ncbi:hypothetical protein HYFRA_00000901 [Hymenoscyphus fraxineus]|uniref:Uncharacterized protein n=1 Tax=Hymenoscyphus fraxineus TaxID=746836 RepID=A0A9N9PS48_9HELO|nr:hypothetical protein HYFRA_00000901 [Hymenoscyphus fraxineus]
MKNYFYKNTKFLFPSFYDSIKMRFSYLLSAFLATLTIASPIANPEAASLSTRATVDTAEYTSAIKAHSGLKKDDWVWFTMEWPRGSVIGDGDTESKEELSQLRDKLGFDHIGLVVGHVTEVTTGRRENLKTKRNFEAHLYHMTEEEDRKTKELKTTFKSPFWKADPSKILKFGGMTTSKKDTAANKAGKNYVNDDAHKKYAVDGNNCNDFVNAVKKAL